MPICLLICYLFCPGGAEPDGFTFSVSVSCVNPLPVHDGCWPPGELPPLFVHPVSVVSSYLCRCLIQKQWSYCSG
jgi:hypothetical protein